MFTANVSLVPCAISHNPLPQCQEPVLGYCPPHLFCIASRPQHFLFSFIFGQLFSSFHPPRFFLWLFSTSTFTFILLLSFTFLILFSITLFSVNWTPKWNYNNLKSKIFQFPNLSFLFPFSTLDRWMQGPPELITDGKQRDCTALLLWHLLTFTPIITFSSLLKCWVLPGQESCCLPLGSRGSLVELIPITFHFPSAPVDCPEFALCSFTQPQTHTSTHTHMHMPGLVVQNLVCLFLFFQSLV